jgi:protein disulfide-isomerase A6
VPDWKKVAKALKGIVKVVAVDATAETALAQAHGVRGYPTIKLFSAGSKAPSDYQGARDAKAIVAACMKTAQALASSRIGGGLGGGGSGGGGSGGAGSGGSGGEFAKSAVVALGFADFRAKVLEADRPWLVSFYAPWCGHCKRLEPEWKQAAQTLGEQFGFGAVDATAEGALAQEYGVQGYPTIKYFHRGEVEAYEGPREAGALEEFAFAKLEAVGKAPEVPQLVGQPAWERACERRKNALCVLAFLPHILDSGASGRNAYLEVLQTVAKKNRRSPVTFAWAEAGSQPALEESLGGFGIFPAVVALSAEKRRFATMRDAFETSKIGAFLIGVLTGRTSTSEARAFGRLESVDAWDGQDGVLPEEEPLDAYDDIELDG